MQHMLLTIIVSINYEFAFCFSFLEQLENI